MINRGRIRQRGRPAPIPNAHRPAPTASANPAGGRSTCPRARLDTTYSQLGGSTELHRVGFPGVLASAIRPDANSSSDTPEDAKRDQRGSVLQSERCRATTISGVVAAPDGETVKYPRRQGVDQHRKSRPSRSLLRQPDGSRLGPIGRRQGRHSAHPSRPVPTAPPRT